MERKGKLKIKGKGRKEQEKKAKEEKGEIKQKGLKKNSELDLNQFWFILESNCI